MSLMMPEAAQRHHDLRDLFDALRWLVRAGLPGVTCQATSLGGNRLDVMKLPEAKRGFVLLSRRWVVERRFAWATRFRPPAPVRQGEEARE